MFDREFENGCVLILGGAKSGKSTLALRLCEDMERSLIFFATAEARDAEMEERIGRHRSERGDRWTTVEEPLELRSRIKELDREDTVILVDCLTLWLSNLFMRHEDDREEIYRQINGLADGLKGLKGVVVLVSNEVGEGIVPENRLARDFRDAAGYMNQHMAAVARKVIVTFAGLPMILKDE
ncbi:MAG: bifunctional adenosylcobinamide kinase/adenosylcobinamide-phosphate guanylyltransferase [Deltaproteobacteria bacterium]|nr:bifunctional adenosylcobinamide kinase/adenosylcobinamide-phosphate guanylyltransferase [Deltaproteobacteria bacterium]